MNNISAKVDTFLKKYGMHYDNIDIPSGIGTFIEEMEQGLCGGSSTLKMLCTYISPEGEIPAQEPVIVMDAGGTNFRVAVVTFDSERKPEVEDFKVYPIPGTNGEISKEEFFATLAQYLKPVIHRSSKIGFCFSYPTKILPNKDGKLIQFNKEVRVSDMVGVELGAHLLQTLKANGVAGEKKIVLLNDTVATLLGGKAAFPDRKFESYIGFILGTGTNTCYVEENGNIHKAPFLQSQPGTTIINIESGGYGKAPRGEIDIKLDDNTADPGNQQFEKMISGAYQGNLALEVIRKAVEKGLFSKQFGSSLRNIRSLSSREIDEFCYFPYSLNHTLGKCVHMDNPDSSDDLLTLYHMIDAIFERAAKLVTINIAAVICKTGKGKNPCLPVCVAAEGTTFYKSKLFRGKLDFYIKKHLNDEMGIYCEFVKTDNATLIGTAIAGLIN